MIDAYEIGITLALQNGVSEGLAAVRRDLGALDQAIAATAQGLARLQVVAGGAVGASEGELRRIAAAAVARPAAARPGPAAAAVEPALAPGAAAARVVEREGVAPVRAPVAPAAVATAERAGGRAAVVVAGAAPVAAPIAAAVPAAPSVSAAVAAQPAVAAAVAAPVVVPPAVRATVPGVAAPAMGSAAPVPVAPAAAPRMVAPVVVAPVPALRMGRAAQGEGERPLAPAPPVPAAPDFAAFARAMSPVRVEATTVPGGAGREPAGGGAAGLPERSVAPTAPTMRDGTQRRAAAPMLALPPPVATVAPGAAAAGPVREAGEGARQGAAAGPTHGDVFLDGTRVGRWMSERMTREADRPPSGPTGFDGRRSPAWPGATVGP